MPFLPPNQQRQSTEGPFNKNGNDSIRFAGAKSLNRELMSIVSVEPLFGSGCDYFKLQ